MKFSTVNRIRPNQASYPDGAYLEADNWNDYGFTVFWTLYYSEGGEVTKIGGVRIGNTADVSKAPPEAFSNLGSEFFSLGVDETYYELLNKLDSDIRVEILQGLRDIAFDLALFRQVQHLDVTQNALLRSIKPIAVQTQYHRMAMGGVRLSPYSFSYSSPDIDRNGNHTIPCRLHFQVNPEANPRTNVHVLIGSNGVGKSFTLNDIATALTRPEASKGSVEFDRREDELLTSRFANVVSVTYSAFDAFEPGRQSTAKDAVPHKYIGLKSATSMEKGSPVIKDHHALAQDFGVSMKSVVDAQLLERWRHYVGFLTSDPLFSDIVERLTGVSSDEFRDEARKAFRELSSGHKIVLLILTRLVETVEEATLVLIDEPESHLHPPLLSALMGALTRLLEDRNGVAIMATHSPVVAQEVPSNCVWKLLGSGSVLTAQRTIIETYGENVGTLTQEIFGLEVTQSGFHRALAEAVRDGGDYEENLAKFESRLGAEARALLQSMIYFARR